MAKITPASSRAARGLLNWSMRDLAEASGVSLPTVLKAEKDGGSISKAMEDRLLATFAEHGVEVLNGNAPGARMRPKAEE